ncbi:hypothetical protein [Asaia krungthepensis]|uniref:Uncharacterized protein n=1 Tax=Asaia krungthepensis NRIC 0535 TaxID=1307925 RepID=A0ABQ0PZW2_9PROT|nr:hypothetical protein [Asaia krungthepensis]GBQ85693.1 hypothetical protein AA0535_0831 [Asaia krungthepensis NRIC 0535]
MARFLLTWHGAIVCWEHGILRPASLTEVAKGHVTPLLLDESLSIVDGPSCIRIEPAHSDAHPGAIVIRSGSLHVSCRNGQEFLPVPQQAGWEHFMPLMPENVSLLAYCCETTWVTEDRHLAKAQCSEFALSFGNERFALDALHLSPGGDTLTLPDGRRYTAFPDVAFATAVKTVETLLRDPETIHISSVWANGSQLAEALFHVITIPHHAPHLYHLARLCALLDLNEAALACLDALVGRMTTAELSWARAIVVYRQGKENDARDCLRDALLDAATRSQREPLILRTMERFLAPGFHPLVVSRIANELYQVYFDAEFLKPLVPSRLPADAGYELRQAYLQTIEELWGHCHSDKRELFIETEHEANGESHALRIVQGHEAWYRGATDQANAHYERARQLSMESGLHFVHFNCGAYSWLTGSPRSAEPDPLDLSGWTWDWHGGEDGEEQPDLCVVAGSDKGYFRFVPKLIASLVQGCAEGTRPGMIRLVLGIASPNPDQIAFLQRVALALSAARSPVALSFAHGILAHNDGATFSCIRYLMMPEIVTRFSCPVMTTDMDAMFPADFLPLSEDLRARYDYGFRLYAFDKEGRQFMGEPWGFGAGVSFFGETALLPTLAQGLHDYIRTAYLTANPTNWCIDQCALAAVFHHHLKPRWAALRIRFMDIPPTPVVMPHHTGMDKNGFAAWDGIVSTDRIYSALGIDPAEANALIT